MCALQAYKNGIERLKTNIIHAPTTDITTPISIKLDGEAVKLIKLIIKD